MQSHPLHRRHCCIWCIGQTGPEQWVTRPTFCVPLIVHANRVITTITHGSDYNNQDTQHSMHTEGSLASKSLIINHSVYSKASNNWPRSVATKL